MTIPTVCSSDNRTVQLNGGRLRELRRDRALTRELLANASAGPHRLSLATIKRAESGAAVYLETARRMAALLHVPLDVILTPSRPAVSSEASAEPPALTETSAAVAVLPFRVVGSDERAKTLAAGLVEDLTTRLGYAWFPIICCSSTRHCGSLEASEAATELHADYLVEGSVQRSGKDLRVHARLIRAATREQLWQGEFNRHFSTLFVLQDELANSILEGVHRRMTQLVSRRTPAEHPSDLEAWELVTLASQLLYEGTERHNELAREHLRQAVARDGSIGWAWYLLAQTHQQDLIHQWSRTPAEALRQLSEVSSEFERQHPRDARASLLGAYVQLYAGRRAAAADRVRAAIEAGPNLPRAYCLYGQVLAMGNEPDAALEQLEMCLRLSPRDGERWGVQAATALAHFVAERYVEASSWAEEAARQAPGLPFTQAILASISAWAGNDARSRQALARLGALHPGMSVSGFGVINSATDPDIAQRFLDGLRRAGLPQ